VPSPQVRGPAPCHCVSFSYRMHVCRQEVPAPYQKALMVGGRPQLAILIGTSQLGHSMVTPLDTSPRVCMRSSPLYDTHTEGPLSSTQCAHYSMQAAQSSEQALSGPRGADLHSCSRSFTWLISCSHGVM
jgi:hypothetical protein